MQRHLVGMLAIVAMVVAACGGGAGSAATTDLTDGLPVVDALAGPPGTPLADGFVVADGTVLVGGTVPTGVSHYFNGEPVVDDGWTATLMVDGDPLDVVEAYLAQATSMGLVVVPTSEVTFDHTAPDVPLSRCAEEEMGVHHYVCSAMARSPAPGPSLSVRLARGAIGGQFMSHLELRYSTTEMAWSAETSGVWGDGEAPVPPLPETWPALPAAGSFSADWPVLHELVVEPGSRLGAPAFVTTCATGGSTVVLQVSGAPDDVFEGYAEQISAFVGEPAEVSEPETWGDAVVRRAYGAEAGGYHYTVTLVVRDGDKPFITLDGCND